MKVSLTLEESMGPSLPKEKLTVSAIKTLLLALGLIMLNILKMRWARSHFDHFPSDWRRLHLVLLLF